MTRGTYLLTFTCYGAHPPAAVDRAMKAAPYRLDTARRTLALHAIREVCRDRAWILLALHVRLTHVHIVVEADQPPELVMATLKSYISRALNRVEPSTSDGPATEARGIYGIRKKFPALYIT